MWTGCWLPWMAIPEQHEGGEACWGQNPALTDSYSDPADLADAERLIFSADSARVAAVIEVSAKGCPHRLVA